MGNGKKIGIAALSAALMLSAVSPALAQSPVQATAASAKDNATANVGSGAAAAGNPADARTSKEEAIALAKKLVDIPEDYRLTSANFNALNTAETSTARPSWVLLFTKKTKDQITGNISVSLDSDSGKLLEFYSGDRDEEKLAAYPPKVDRQQAQAIGERYIAKQNAVDQSSLKLNPLYNQSNPPLQGSVLYQFHYERQVGGIGYSQNYIDISVDGAGKVVSYQWVWDSAIQFEDAAGLIAAADAKTQLLGGKNLQLSYLVPYNSKDGQWFLTLQNADLVVNAKTGKLMNSWNLKEVADEDLKPIAEQAAGQKPAKGTPLTKEQAIAGVKKFFEVPAGAVLEDASYNEDTDQQSGEETSYWNLTWSVKEDGKDTQRIWASVNGRTGEMQNYSSGDVWNLNEKSDAAAEPKISLEKAKALAVELVKNMVPYAAHQLTVQYTGEPVVVPLDGQANEQTPIRSYSFSFSRMIDGVAANGEQIGLTIDAQTGNVTQYSNSLTDTAYPEKHPEVVAQEKLNDLLLSRYDVQLAYADDQTVQVAQYGTVSMEKYKLMVASGEVAAGASTGGKKAVLVYRLKDKYSARQVFLDAHEGIWRSQETGAAAKLIKEQATDIEGHWAQRELQLMIDYEALEVKDGLVHPNATISRGEMIKMLMIAMNGGDDGFEMAAGRQASFADVASTSVYFGYVERAVDAKLVDPAEGSFNPEAAMTRDELAQYIVKALGYGKLAEFDSLFTLQAADKAAIKHKGQAAIAVGLGILSLDKQGKFEPTGQVSRAEAAAAFYRFLQKRAELQDSRQFN